MNRATRPIAERFWEKVDKSGECWLWTAHLDRDGYGRFDHGGAHRTALKLTGVAIPQGVVVDHICHTPACVRPSHLRVCTQKQNCENRSGAQQDNTTSGVRGVSWHKPSRNWKAYVRHNGIMISVGYFSTINEAEQAVIAKRNELFTHNDADRVEVAA